MNKKNCVYIFSGVPSLTPWGEWSECTICGADQKKTRSRDCACSKKDDLGQDFCFPCIDPTTEEALCEPTSCDYSDYSDFGSCSHITSCLQTLSVTASQESGSTAAEVDGTYSLIYSSMQPNAIYMRQDASLDPMYIHYSAANKLWHFSSGYWLDSSLEPGGQIYYNTGANIGTEYDYVITYQSSSEDGAKARF